MNNILEKTSTMNEIGRRSDLSIRRVLVAVDLTAHSEKTAAYAVAFARRFGASITLAHVFATKPSTTFSVGETPEQEERHWTERRLASLVEEIRQTYPDCDLTFGTGDPAEEVSRIALALNADLIITGSRHPGFLSRLFELEQAPRIVRRAGCPVLVYHEEAD